MASKSQIVVVHLSDMHMTSDLFNRQFSRIGGWRAHDRDLCSGLELALEDVRVLAETSDEEPLFIVMSGDLTSEGRDGDFACAYGFLFSRRPFNLDRPSEDQIGLGMSGRHVLAIPGNHDHWKGQRLPAFPFNPEIYGKYFQSPPWRHTLSSRDGQMHLELFGLDSNSGLAGLQGRVDAVLARGSIHESSFRHLESLLKKSYREFGNRDGVLRAIVVHHPFWVPPTVVGAQKLDDPSLTRLLELAFKNRIPVVLTGHTHDFAFTPKVLQEPPVPIAAYEVRCATTTQGPADEGPKGFCVHQITLEGTTRWRVWRYQWAAGFVRLGSDPWLEIPLY